MKQAKKYYVATRPQTNHIHSIHSEGCPFMPDDNKRIYLGAYSSVDDARREGRKYYQSSCACRFCLKDNSKNESIIEMGGSIYPTPEQLSAAAGALLCFLN
jgi:hypothetical protein